MAGPLGNDRARHSLSFGDCMDYKFLKEGILLAL